MKTLLKFLLILMLFTGWAKAATTLGQLSHVSTLHLTTNFVIVVLGDDSNSVNRSISPSNLLTMLRAVVGTSIATNQLNGGWYRGLGKFTNEFDAEIQGILRVVDDANIEGDAKISSTLTVLGTSFLNRLWASNTVTLVETSGGAALTVNTNQLVVTSGNVGLGTNSPKTTLHVHGSSYFNGVKTNTGNVYQNGGDLVLSANAGSSVRSSLAKFGFSPAGDAYLCETDNDGFNLALMFGTNSGGGAFMYPALTRDGAGLKLIGADFVPSTTNHLIVPGTVFASNGVFVGTLTASRPTLSDASKNLVSGQIDLANANHITGLLPTANAASGITLDTEWDTIGEIETATGVNIILNTEIDTSSELATIVTDETGSGGLVFSNAPSLNAVNLSGVNTASNLVTSGYNTTQGPKTNASTLQQSGAAIFASTVAISGTATHAASLQADTGYFTNAVTNASLTASRLVATDANKALSSTISSANVASSVSDETGSGGLVFSNAPSINAPSVTGAATFSSTVAISGTATHGGAAQADSLRVTNAAQINGAATFGSSISADSLTSTNTATISGLLSAQGGLKFKRKFTGTNYTALASDVIIHCTNTGPITITLTAAATVGDGGILVIKDAGGNAGAQNITIDGNASETIDGATTKVLNANFQSATVYTDGVAWFVW